MWKILPALLPFALAGEPLTCLMNDDDHICMRSTNVTHPPNVEPCEVGTHTCLSLVFDGNYTQGAGCVSKADATVGGTCSYLQQYAGYIGRDIQCSYCDTNDCNTCNIPPEDLLSCQQDIDHDIGFGFDDNRAICKGTTITTLNFPCFRNTSHWLVFIFDYLIFVCKIDSPFYIYSDLFLVISIASLQTTVVFQPQDMDVFQKLTMMIQSGHVTLFKIRILESLHVFTVEMKRIVMNAPTFIMPCLSRAFYGHLVQDLSPHVPHF